MDFEIFTPVSSDELFQFLTDNKDKDIRMGAGFTDLTLDLKKKNPKNLIVINLSGIHEQDFSEIRVNENEIRVGALVTAATIVNNKYLQEHFPVLTAAAKGLASMQIREVATIGGNLCQASPSGDLSCALVSLKAVCEIISPDNKVRTEALPGFFRGPGKTSLEKGEVLRSIVFPVNSGNKIKSGFIKIGKKAAMECSVVSLAYHILSGDDGVVVSAGIACGAVAPTVIFCEGASSFLKGKNATSLQADDIEQLAAMVRQKASPIDDIRASAWYRNEVLFNSVKSIFSNYEC